MGASKRRPEELRERAVRMVFEAPQGVRVGVGGDPLAGREIWAPPRKRYGSGSGGLKSTVGSDE